MPIKKIVITYKEKVIREFEIKNNLEKLIEDIKKFRKRWIEREYLYNLTYFLNESDVIVREEEKKELWKDAEDCFKIGIETKCNLCGETFFDYIDEDLLNTGILQGRGITELCPNCLNLLGITRITGRYDRFYHVFSRKEQKGIQQPLEEKKHTWWKRK